MPRKSAAHSDRVTPRPVTDALRRQVREELPEIGLISDQQLQEKVVEAWAFALAGSSFKSIREFHRPATPAPMRPCAAIRPITCAA